jgi:ABC-type phosphate transport system ATPase subunit
LERTLKKIDLHIHTIPTFRDADFIFSLAKLREYVISAELDAIAITNHDMFDMSQFNEITADLDCMVFPGIEINLERGHILLIAENENVDDFQIKSEAVSEKITAVGDSITVDELVGIFGELNNYLLIPHYKKKPAILGDTLDQIAEFISAGEVDSPKKFIRMVKDDSEITPVIFSDVRIRENMTKFPTRQTYIDCGDLSLNALRFNLRDRNKVALSSTKGNSLFQVFDDGQKLSTGLNIVMGVRSSGKTVTLKRINEDFDNVKYIPQFSLVQIDDKKYEKQFKADVARKKSIFVEQYLNPFKTVLDDILNVDIGINSRSMDNYLLTLMNLAEDADKRDSFSKAALFNESQFEVGLDNGLSDLIRSVRNLIENIEYRKVIDKHISVEDLKALVCELISLLWSKTYEREKKILVNNIIRDIQSRLQLRASVTTISNVDFYNIMLERNKVLKFTKIAKLLQAKKVILEENIQGFKVVCKQRAFVDAGEIKKVSGTIGSFLDAYGAYADPYKYLKALKGIEALSQSEFYKHFACIEYEILNKDGFEVSGGERSEFRLVEELKDAQNFDYLIVDEPESSFDNLFLKGEVNQMLKEISKTMPVVVVTHNSTVGASINPDYIVYTSKELEGKDIVYRRYSGHPSDKELCSVDGKKINNFQVTLNALEAGEDAYIDRRYGYESIKD